MLALIIKEIQQKWKSSQSRRDHFIKTTPPIPLLISSIIISICSLILLILVGAVETNKSFFTSIIQYCTLLLQSNFILPPLGICKKFSFCFPFSFEIFYKNITTKKHLLLKSLDNLLQNRFFIKNICMPYLSSFFIYSL